MIYETQITFTKINDKGVDVTVKESYILADVERFTDAENKMYEIFEALPAFDVTVVKRSRITEIANKANADDDKIFIADISDTVTNDDGSEKEVKYKIALFASSIDVAHDFIREYLQQGYSMKLCALKETKFVDVL